MAEEQRPAKKVAKRVVRKTVVKRPVQSRPVPTVRYGRPTAAPRKPPTARAVSPRKAPVAPRPSMDLGRKAGRATGKVVHVVGGTARSIGFSISDTMHTGWGHTRSMHFPRLQQTRAAALVGAFVGLIIVAMTALLTMLFSQVRGVSTGGGTWGSLTVVVVAFIAFALGEFLLTKMYVRQPRITSFLALCLELVVIMAALLAVINTGWAWLIMPLLGAVSFAVSHRIIAVADSSPREI